MIAPGTLLQNRYLVEEQIGQGGMGAVFVATDQRFGSKVALKETFFDDPNLRKAFEREAKLLNRLRHHALPRVSDHFTEEEGQFLVMEYIAGSDLSDMLKLRGGAFPLGEVLDWADQLLDALDYLHTQEPSVIHRDIKPQNLKLTARNQIILLDFGLAKGTPLQSRVTATGSVLGYSLNYAPLEQMQGTGTDPRSDLYSLGATLYHLLTGTTPPDALTRATAFLNGEADPLRPASEVHAQVPVAVADVLTRAMSQSAARRFATAAEMREALKQTGREISPSKKATNVQPRPRPKNLFYDQSGLFEDNETQLLNTNAVTNQPSTVNLRADETEVNDLLDAPTVTDGARTAHAATHAATSVRESESVVTNVRAPQAPAPKGGRSRRTVGVAAGVAVLAVIAAVYAFTRRAEQPAAGQQTPTLNVNSSTAQPSATATVESLPQAAEAPSPTPAPASPQPAARRTNEATAARGGAPANEDKGARVKQAVVAPEVPVPPDPVAEDARQAQGNPNPGVSKEELQAIMQRVAKERRRAVQRRREAERERRRRRGLPPPPTL